MTVVYTGDEMAREQERRTSHRERVLQALRAAGAAGVLNVILCRKDIGGSRAGGRVQEWRDRGYVIDCDRVEDGVYRYTLRAEPARAPRPGERGYLASLPSVASINPRTRVTPVEDDTPRPGSLF